MNTSSNNIMKKNNTLGIKHFKKSIQINITSNPIPSKFLFSNHINKIASSYLSMGRRIQNEGIKASKTIHINANFDNYYTLKNKENNKTNISGVNKNQTIKNNKNNNYINISSINNHSQQKTIHNKDSEINTKNTRRLSNLSKSRISNNLLNNAYHTSKNNNYKNILNDANNLSHTNNSSNNHGNYINRQDIIDSKNRNEKIPIKSKLRKYQYKNSKTISTSLNKDYLNKRHFKGNNQRDKSNYIKKESINNYNEKKHFNNNSVNNNYFFDNKNVHYRNNTDKMKNKEITNIFHQKTLTNTFNFKNNENLNRNINIKKIISSVNKNNYNNEANLNKINNNINSRKELSKNLNLKININDKLLYSKDNKIIPNNNIKNHHNFYYSTYLSNNGNDNNTIDNNNNAFHHIKNFISDNFNKNIKQKILAQPEEIKKRIYHNNNKLNQRNIPNQYQKLKKSIIPIKIKLDKFFDVDKNKQDNKSKLKDSNSNISQINDKLSTRKSQYNKEEKHIIKDKLKNKKSLDNRNNIFIKIDEINKNDKIENTISFISNPLKDSKYKIDSIQEDLNNNNKLFEINKNNNSQINYDINRETNYSTITTQDNIRNTDHHVKSIINDNKKQIIPKNRNIQKLSDLNNLNLIKNSHNSNKEKNNKNKEINKNFIDNEENKKLNCNDNNKNDKDKFYLNKLNNNEQFNKTLIKKITFDDNNKLLKKDLYVEKNLVDNDIIKNDLFNEDNLDELPKDYDENFNDLYSLIKQIKFRNIIINIEGIFTTEGKDYMNYRYKFDKMYDNLFIKKKNSFSNHSIKTKKFFEATSNTKTNYSSSKKHNDIRPNAIFEDLKFEN